MTQGLYGFEGTPMPIGQSLRLSSNVPLVTLQFSFTDWGKVPLSVTKKSHETRDESRERRDRKVNAPSGRPMIQPLENCSLAQFVDELRDQAGYELVAASYQPRVDQRNPKKTYYMVQYVFRHHAHMSAWDHLPSNGFGGYDRSQVLADLKVLCKENYWRVRSYLNPFFKNGESVTGMRSVSVNMEACVPLYHPNGEKVTQWQKDGNGRRVGTAPVPITPTRALRATSGIIQLN